MEKTLENTFETYREDQQRYIPNEPRVLVVGAGGRVGRALTEILAMQRIQVVAGGRHPEDIHEAQYIRPLQVDLHDSVAELAEKMDAVDAVICVAGSRGKDLLQTDAFGVVKLIQAAEASAARRFVLLSSLFALQPEKWQEIPSLKDIINYDIAKFFADSWLVRNADLDYTIVQPSSLTEEAPTGQIQLNPTDPVPNPIGDVAQVLADVLFRPNTYRKVINMCGGTEPIAQALASI